ncbi:calcium/sodium antiporter [Candidatus Woesearchaeota archaeon]|nr:calcium/sodium antiporter [Candidatus Woesearchaeota archaeon]
MVPLVAWILIFIISLAVLVKGSDWFTEAAEKLSHKLGISPFIIGVTVVSVGTSLPELASSIAAVLAGKSEIVIGNVLGSNIANILLVLGLGAVIAGKISTKWELRQVDFPVLFAATFLLVLMCLDGAFTLFEALFMLAGYAIYLNYLHNKNKKKVKKQKVTGPIWIPLLAGGVLIYVGARFTVESVIGIASATGIPNDIIAVSAVALGTSLPELFVTVTAALKGKHDLALGNILGSNIFNLFAVMGITGLFGTLLIPSTMLWSLAMLVIATFMLYFVTSKDKTVTRWEGWLLLLLYAFFVVRLFV